jgi:hypothetical protein
LINGNWNQKKKKFTVMKVIVKGESKTVEYNLLDRYDAVTKTSSMARNKRVIPVALPSTLSIKDYLMKKVFFRRS